MLVKMPLETEIHFILMLVALIFNEGAAQVFNNYKCYQKGH